MSVATIGDALAQTKPIVLVDDFVGRGSQAIDVIEAWLGVEPRTFDLNEERRPLDPAMRPLLEQARLASSSAQGR